MADNNGRPAASAAVSPSGDAAGELAALVDDIFDAFEQRDWDCLRAAVADEVELDHTSLRGGQVERFTRDEIVAWWQSGLHPKKRNLHLQGRYRIRQQGDTASVSFNCYVLHALVEELGGGLWECWGRHTLSFRRTPDGWRATRFAFARFHARGDESVYRHTLPPAEAASAA